MKIELAFKSNYGTTQWYALDENARMAHYRLTGRKTFNEMDIAAYAQIGIEVIKTEKAFNA